MRRISVGLKSMQARWDNGLPRVIRLMQRRLVDVFPAAIQT